MEYVGWGVKKELPERGTLSGVVQAFEPGFGRFHIVYEGGESEKLDWSGLSSILVYPESSSGLPPENKLCCIFYKGENSCNSVGGSDVSSVIVEKSEGLRAFDLNLNNDDCSNGECTGDNADGVKFVGFDLNQGLSSELDQELYIAGGDLAPQKGIIDLNLDADECIDRFKGNGKARCIDLNLQLPEDEATNADGFEAPNAKACDGVVISKDDCTETRRCEDDYEAKIKKGKRKSCDHKENVSTAKGARTRSRSRKFASEGETESGITKLQSRNMEMNGDESKPVRRSRKRKEVSENGVASASSLTGLRRSSRRARRISAPSATDHETSEVVLVHHSNQVSSPATSVILDEILTAFNDSPSSPILPPKMDLPPTSSFFDLDGSLVFDCFYIYSFLRSFSNLLFLSPFEMEDFVASAKCNDSTLLFDSIHVSLLRTLRKHLETLSNEGSASASECLRSLNWDLLDLITWPMFLLQYIILHCTWYTPSFKLFEKDYYQLPVSTKLEMLKNMCDDVSDGESFRSDINRRETEIERLTDLERSTRLDGSRKRKAAFDSSCLTEENLAEAADLNSDECHLCKMDGNLICCDGCPAAFHSRCVGVVSSLLPEGHWYCPECVIEKRKGEKSMKVRNSIRAEVLGRDPYGRLYYACCGYLFLLESLDDDYSSNKNYASRLYNRDDLPKLLEAFDSSPAVYDKIKIAICEHWSWDYGLVSTANDADTASHSVQSQFSDINHMPSEVSRTAIRANASRKARLSCSEAVPKIQNSRVNYVNHYEFSRTASSYFGGLASDKSSDDLPLSAEEIIARQLKVITNRFSEFAWSSTPLSNSTSGKERCGWCFFCKTPEDGRDCLFVLKNNIPSVEKFPYGASGIQTRNTGNRHLIDVIHYIICLEDYLLGLLSGPWLNLQYSTIWRQALLTASSISSLKDLLLKLESNLHHLALSSEWSKHVDSVATMGSSCHIVMSSIRASSRNGISRRRAQSSDFGATPSSKEASGLSLFWWRGGRGSRKIFNWKVLPRALVSKAARQGGCRKIPGILYSENGDYAKRTKRISWRAAVETSRSIDQLALQVRELDANIRWHEISNTRSLLKTDKSFRKVVIRRKLSDGAVTKYLLDFGKRRFVPDAVIRYGSVLEDSKSRRKKYWLEDSYVPLHLIKCFEEKRIARISLKSNSSVVHSAARRNPEKKGFAYLISRFQASHCSACGHRREAVICKEDEGFNRRKRIRKSAGAVIDGCFCACHKSEDVKITKKKKKKLKKGKKKKKKFEFPEAEKLQKRPLLVFSRKFKKSRNGKRVLYTKRLKELQAVPLRRSARFSEPATKNPVPKRRGRKKKAEEKVVVPLKAVSRTKRRTPMYSSYWLNGLRLSRRPNDVRFTHLRDRLSILHSQQAVSVVDNNNKPKCSLCLETDYDPSMNYVACTICGVWFHGDAVGLSADKLENVIEFKCHHCLNKTSPVCRENPNGGRQH